MTRESGFLLPHACLQELKSLQSSQADAVVKQILAGDFKEFSSPVLPINIKEAVLERLDFADPLFSPDKQRALLRVLEEDGNYFRTLTLRNCSAEFLNDASLARILQASESRSHLQYLNVHGCKGVGREQKETGLFLTFLNNSSSFLYLETLAPLLKRLDLSETSVVSLRISLPYLETIRALKCHKLEVFDLKSPILSAVDISVSK